MEGPQRRLSKEEALMMSFEGFIGVDLEGRQSTFCRIKKEQVQNLEARSVLWVHGTVRHRSVCVDYMGRVARGAEKSGECCSPRPPGKNCGLHQS